MIITILKKGTQFRPKTGFLQALNFEQKIKVQIFFIFHLERILQKDVRRGSWLERELFCILNESIFHSACIF